MTILEATTNRQFRHSLRIKHWSSKAVRGTAQNKVAITSPE